MNLKKIIIGFAQSDKNYGFSKNRNFGSVVEQLENIGIRSIDTAPNYQKSETFIRKINQTNKFNIYTKLPNFNCDLKNLKYEVNNSISKILKKNSLKKINTLLIHDPLLPLDSKKWNIIYPALNKLKKRGTINKLGISVYTVNELNNALKIFKPDVIQFPLNIFNQEFLENNLLRNLKKNGITLIARSIFLQGVLCNKNYKNKNLNIIWNEKLKNWFSFSKKISVPPEEICINFIKSQKYIDKILIGVDNNLQLQKNLKIFKSNKRPNYLHNLKIFYDQNDILNDPRYWFKINNIKNAIDWSNAKKYILNGGMLLSKKPSQFIPGEWPTFYKKASGCFIWDNYNNKLLDFSLMGVGTNILGYSNKIVNKEVKKEIDNSNVSTLNSRYDFILSKKLLSMHKWASKSLFARTGGEANAIAIRIARTYSKKHKIAVCGYHGWHDWYLSANLKNQKSLDNLLLPGLSTIGIPDNLKGVTYPFKYNDLNSLKKIIKKNKNIGIIFMEVERNQKPKNNFLQKVRHIANKKNIVLIFDECTSGFRETYGGLHKKYNIEPDIAVFGKSIANGIPLTAVLIKDKLISRAKQSFISSTFWTESLGPVAALTTLKVMSKEKSWKKITKIGKKIKTFWIKMSKKYNLPLEILGLDAMPMFKFRSIKDQYYKSYITQEMLKKNILATNTVYCSMAHDKYVDRYFFAFEKIFKKLKQIDNNGDIFNHLEFPISSSGFGRLN